MADEFPYMAKLHELARAGLSVPSHEVLARATDWGGIGALKVPTSWMWHWHERCLNAVVAFNGKEVRDGMDETKECGRGHALSQPTWAT